MAYGQEMEPFTAKLAGELSDGKKKYLPMIREAMVESVQGGEKGQRKSFLHRGFP
jgi:hypothetical protein